MSKLESQRITRHLRSLPWVLIGAVASACQPVETEVASNENALSVDKIDILLVVDDSASMQSVQGELPALLDGFARGEGPEGGEFPPVTDVHLGVVTTDMGIGGVVGVPGCDGVGQDGVMLPLAAADLAACDVMTANFLALGDGAADATVEQLGCLPTIGQQGCGFEQPLEAALKSLWPSARGEVEFPMSVGHGDGENAGFLRDDSLLIVVVVTDEDDCSAQDATIFTPSMLLDPNDPLAEQPINLRCMLNDDALHDPARYVEGLRALRPDNDNLLFVALAGIPSELIDAEARGAHDLTTVEGRQAFYQGVIDAPEMALRYQGQDGADPLDPRTLTEPSCLKPDGGPAYPPRRLVEVARQFDDRAVLGTICQGEAGAVTGAIIRAVAERL